MNKLSNLMLRVQITVSTFRAVTGINKIMYVKEPIIVPGFQWKKKRETISLQDLI